MKRFDRSTVHDLVVKAFPCDCGLMNRGGHSLDCAANHIPTVVRLVRQVVEECADVADNTVGGFTANIRVSADEQEMIRDPDGPWVLNCVIADAIRAMFVVEVICSTCNWFGTCKLVDVPPEQLLLGQFNCGVRCPRCNCNLAKFEVPHV